MQPENPHNNVTESVAKHLERKLLHQPNHPLQILKSKIYDYFDESFKNMDGSPQFEKMDDLSPVVTTQASFDELLIPEKHQIRLPSDTYFVSDTHVLRPHTSAHQTELMRQGKNAFLCAGDVYRRDEIDQSHYPVFHQMEGVLVLPETNADGSPVTSKDAEEHLKRTLEGLVRAIFGDVEMRFVDAYFPFTEPSLEVEIWFNDDWLEVLGAGVVHAQVMTNGGLPGRQGWAFGLGLERLAMVLFDIPDIRLFWTHDARFHEQFKDGQITKFKPYSKYPPCLKDISFWLPGGAEYHPNDFYSLARDVGGDLIERVELIDDFVHPKTSRQSHCYRLTYRSMDRNLTNAEIDDLQEIMRAEAERRLLVELR